MNKIRVSGFIILMCGIAINLIFNTESTDIAGAVIIGLGIGVLLTGRFGKFS